MLEQAELRAAARRILTSNDRGGYTVPTHGLYPYQWNWDSAFVALGFSTFDVGRAVTELESLFEGQWINGMVPHIIFRADERSYFPGPSVWRANHSPPTSGITQPSVAASVAWQLWQKADDESDQRRLRALFPKLMASHRWFHQFRDPDHLGIVVMTHPWESGRDNSPEWDEPMANVDTSRVEPYQRRDLDHADASMRPTQAQYDCFVALLQFGRECGWDAAAIGRTSPLRVADVGMSMIHLRANRDLQAMASALGEDEASREIALWIARGEQGAQLLWDPARAAFCSRDLITGKPSGYVTSASFLAHYAGVGSSDQRAALREHWSRISARCSFMCPSFDPEETKFDSYRYWRGPIWAVVNFLIAKGMAEAGETQAAHRLGDDMRALIAAGGFREAFDPITGAGTGGDLFSWTAAMYLAWLDSAND